MSEVQLTTEGLPLCLADYAFVDEYRVPLMSTPPVIDGHVDESEWRCAAGFDGFSHAAKLEDRRVRGYIGATRTHLYFALVSEMPPVGELVTDVKEHLVELVRDDSLEVWIAPYPDAETGITYQMLVNSAGCDAYQTHVVGDIPRDEWYGWDGGYKIANGFHDGFWHCEIEVPLEKVSRGKSVTEGTWSINLTRNWNEPWKFSNLGNGTYEPNHWLRFTFCEDSAAAVQVKHLSDPTTAKIDVVMSAYNPSEEALDLNAHLYLKRDAMPEVAENDHWTLAPGETKELRLSVEDLTSDFFTLFSMVRDRCGSWHYTRHYLWGPAREVRWQTAVQEMLPIDFQFAHYPYLNRIRVLADIAGLDPSAQLDSIEFTVRKKDTGEVAKAFTIVGSEFTGTTYDMTVDMPPLNGDYEIVATARGEGTPTEPLAREFIRYVYEWEHNDLGKSRKVYPPFTPIRVEGNTLHTVMKEYDLSSLGLLEGLRTADQPGIAMKDVLAAPMTYTACVEGENVAISQGRVEVTEAADDVVIAESVSAAGSLSLRARSTLDYDGMLRVDLTLDAERPVEVDSLDLHIPVSANIAKMIHAMCDGGRSQITTMALPKGTGVIWSGTDQLTWSWPRNFVTYIFIGDARRGISWFAENDNAWGWDPKKPNLDLVRSDDGTVSVVVHLVNKPLTVASPRTLTFGLLAAPVKPKLDGWRHRWYTDNFSILGCDRHWFGLSNCGSHYPADMALWDALKRANKAPLADDEIERIIEFGRKYYEPYGWEGHTEEFVEFARRNLKNRAGTKMIFYYNRGSGYVYDEWHTFMDEWSMKDFTNRKRRDPWAVSTIPSESQLDYSMWWYKKSFELGGNIGIYVDNNAFLPGYNTVMTGAHKKDDGSIMPSSGIWGLRALAKRQFTLMNELGMEPITMSHTSTLQILPINAFYTIQYDGEWKYSEGDFHDRFSREYLIHISSGDMDGAWPIMLHEVGKNKWDYWTLRTYHGVCTVHDVIIDRYLWHFYPVPEDSPENPMHYKLRMPLCEMAQEPDCEVYRYWDDRPQPVTSGDWDLPTIVYSLPGREAVVAVTNFSSTDKECVLSIDTDTLGFPGRCTATDMETDEEIAVKNNQIRFILKKHNLRQLKLTRKTG